MKSRIISVFTRYSLSNRVYPFKLHWKVKLPHWMRSDICNKSWRRWAWRIGRSSQSRSGGKTNGQGAKCLTTATDCRRCHPSKWPKAGSGSRTSAGGTGELKWLPLQLSPQHRWGGGIPQRPFPARLGPLTIHNRISATGSHFYMTIFGVRSGVPRSRLFACQSCIIPGCSL